SANPTVILRSRALARRLEGGPLALVAHPSRLAVKNGEHLRMTAVCMDYSGTEFVSSLLRFAAAARQSADFKPVVLDQRLFLRAAPAFDLALGCDPICNSIETFGPNENHRA